MIRFAAIAIIVLLGGCTTRSHDSFAPAETVPVTTNSMMIFNGCHGFVSLTFLPASFLPPPDFAWPSPDYPVGGLKLHLYQCDRINVGSFERPAAIAFEFHSNEHPPESCLDSKYNEHGWLHHIYVSDDQVRAYLAEAWDLPILPLWVTENSTVSNPIYAHSIVFGSADGPPSSINFANISRPPDVYEDFVYRLFWRNHWDAVNVMKFTEATQADVFEAVLHQGVLDRPFLYANTGPTPYVGYGRSVVEAFAEIELEQYGDIECKNPL